MTPEQIKQKILNHFKEASVEVLDTTGIGNNFTIIFSKLNLDKSRLETHREVMKIFDDEFKSGTIHALSIKIQ